MKEIRILMLSHMYPTSINSVSGIFVHQQVQALLKQGCRVKVISPVPYSPRILWTNERRKGYGKTPRSEIVGGISVLHPRYLRLPGSWFHGISGFTMYQAVDNLISPIIAEFNPHVIHAYAATPDGFAGLMLKNKYSIPLVCSLLGSDINIYPYRYRPFTMSFTKKVLIEADGVISVSNALKKTAEKISDSINRIKVIYMGIDSNKFKFDSCYRHTRRSELGIRPNDNVIVYVGNLIKGKGIVELYQAFDALSKKFGSLHVVFVGDGPMHRYLIKISNTSHTSNRVHFVGRRPHDEIPEWLSAADIFVLPSYNEGLPNAVLEAMSCERPVIATNVGGIPEVIEDGKTGLLIKPHDVDSIVEALDFLLSHPEEANIMGERARKLVLENYTWEKNAEKTIEIYKEVLERG